MQLTIKNNDELTAWQKRRMSLGHDMVAVKGPAPAGATYSDGTPIVHPVNILWRDLVTGEGCEIDYCKNDPIRITDSAFFDPLRDAGAATGLEGLRLGPCEPDGTGVGAVCRPADATDSRNARIKELVREYGHACRINATYGARQEAWAAFVNELERA